jgi:hypothetical protein
LSGQPAGQWVFRLLSQRKRPAARQDPRASGLFVVSGTVEQRIASIARLQRGRLTRRQLIAAGIGAGAIDGMLKRGLFRREHAGVYAVLDVGPTRLLARPPRFWRVW